MEIAQPRLRAILAADDFPRMRALSERDYDFDIDAVFAFGLDNMLDGLEARLAARP